MLSPISFHAPRLNCLGLGRLVINIIIDAKCQENIKDDSAYIEKVYQTRGSVLISTDNARYRSCLICLPFQRCPL